MKKINPAKFSVMRWLIRIILKFHNFFYGLAGLFSQKLEPDGLHPKHRIINYHQWFIEQLKPEWSVLDIGCGNGALSADLSKHCREVVGIDISEENIKQAKKRADINFICADVTNYDFKRSFDAIVLSNVLEHIKNRVTFLKNLSKYSKIFLIRAPLLDRDWITLYKKELGVDHRLDKTHFTEYTFDGFIKELENSGLRLDSHRIRYGEIYGVAKAI